MVDPRSVGSGNTLRRGGNVHSTGAQRVAASAQVELQLGHDSFAVHDARNEWDHEWCSGITKNARNLPRNLFIFIY